MRPTPRRGWHARRSRDSVIRGVPPPCRARARCSASGCWSDLGRGTRGGRGGGRPGRECFRGWSPPQEPRVAPGSPRLAGGAASAPSARKRCNSARRRGADRAGRSGSSRGRVPSRRAQSPGQAAPPASRPSTRTDAGRRRPRGRCSQRPIRERWPPGSRQSPARAALEPRPPGLGRRGRPGRREGGLQPRAL